MSKKPRIITFRGDGVNYCKCCEAPMKKSQYNEVCSPSCAKDLLDLKSTPLPSRFVLSLINRTKNEKEREVQLNQYIERHKLDSWKVKMKFNEIATSIANYGYEAIRRKEPIIC